MRNGFTLVEILIAMTILTVTWVMAYSGFQALDSRAEERQVLSRFSQMISSLDSAVQGEQITSYELLLLEWSKGSIIDKNTYSVTDPMELVSYDFDTSSGTVSLTGSITPFSVKKYVDNKLIETIVVGSPDEVTFEFDTLYDNERVLVGYAWGSELNTIELLSFDANNLDGGTTISFSWGTLTGVTLSNIRGKKSLMSTAGNAIRSADLIFLKENREILYTLEAWK